VGDLGGRTSSLFRREPEPTAEARTRLAGELLVKLEPTADSARELEHDIRVGHRRLDATAPVRRRPWDRSGRARPDAERAAIVHPRDRAAAGANRLDRDRRKPH